MDVWNVERYEWTSARSADEYLLPVCLSLSCMMQLVNRSRLFLLSRGHISDKIRESAIAGYELPESIIQEHRVVIRNALPREFTRDETTAARSASEMLAGSLSSSLSLSALSTASSDCADRWPEKRRIPIVGLWSTRVRTRIENSWLPVVNSSKSGIDSRERVGDNFSDPASIPVLKSILTITHPPSTPNRPSRSFIHREILQRQIVDTFHH